MAALASTALPAVALWLERQQLDQAVESFVISVNQAIVDSGQKGVARTVEIELNSDRFRILNQEPAGQLEQLAWSQLPGGVTFRLSDGNAPPAAAGHVLRIEVRTDGRSSGAQFLVCRGQQFRTIEVDRISGLARLIRGS